MSEWEETTIGSFLKRDGGSVKTGPFGTVLKAKEYSSRGVPLISVGEISHGSIRTHEKTPKIPHEVVERLPEYILEVGDIVFGRKGAVDRSALVKPEQAGWFLGSDGIRLRLPPNCNVSFIAYQIQSKHSRAWLIQHATGTTMLSLNQSIIEQLPIVLPPLPEQKAIARILSSLDDKIELNRRMNETLESMARAIFKDWFVDFGPTRAKQEGRAAYLPEHLWSLFPEAIDLDTGLPQGWELATLERLAELNPESWTTRKHPELIKYVDLANTKWGEIEKVEIYEWEKAPSRARRVLKLGDTIVGTVRPGNGSYALIFGEDLTGSTGFAVIRPRRFSDSIFVWAGATLESNIERLQHLADGGAYPAVRPEVVIHTEINLPTLNILDAYSEVALPIIEKGNRNRLESRTLAELRDRLLPKLMSGEIRVKDAEQMVEEVM
jgi:type I restriction enzyme, S subunit